MVLEADVGIEAFANNAPAFNAILRHRYTDFKVNEIAEDMSVARFQVDVAPAPTAARAPWSDANAVQKMVEAFQEVAGQHNADKLQAYLQRQKVRWPPACTLLSRLQRACANHSYSLAAQLRSARHVVARKHQYAPRALK
jgi:hypothetical protein